MTAPRHPRSAPAPGSSERSPDPGGAADVPPLDSPDAALAESESRYVRLAADFENFKRRRAQELADSGRYRSEDAARALLPVLDNLRRAVEHAPEVGADDVLLHGLQLVVREFESALERLGVERISAVGEPFDPAVHEAIGGEESDEVEQDTVSAELVPGYRLHDRLLRPAVVRVAHPRHPQPAPAA